MIFGKHTGKLLNIGVRNKFYAAGVHNKKTQKETDHVCFKNWNDASAKGLLAQFVVPSLTEAK